MEALTKDSPESRSLDVVAGNIEQLKALFPEATTEGRIDFEVLKQLLGGEIEDCEEKFGLNWHGKRQARQLALLPSLGTLRPLESESMNWGNTKNILIEGDNLESLKLLSKSYSGLVDIIYIDPPYNTGNDFVYPDDFKDSIANYLKRTGQLDPSGARNSSNTESSGRFHTDWLNMMYPRLKIAGSLLKKSGIIYISIDDRELYNLKLICDDVFGEECYKGTIVRTSGQTTGQDSGGLGASFDYVLVYSKDPDLELAGLALDDSDLERYQEEDERGKYALWQLRKTGSNDHRADRPTMYFKICDPDGGDVWPIGPTSPANPNGYESRWRFDPKGYARLASGNYIVWKKRKKGEGEEWWPYVKTYLEGRTKRPSPLWDDLEGSKKASIDLRALMGGNVFSNPKPLGLIKRLIQISPNNGKNALVLDFFAGSGTAAHAVMELNKEDSGERRFILIQLPEGLDPNDNDQKLSAEFCDSIGKPRTIAEITKERVRRAIAAIQASAPLFAGDLGFRAFRLDSSNIRPWETGSGHLAETLMDAVEHIKEGRTEQDLLYELLLKLGLDLTVPVEQQTIAGKKVYSIGAGVLMVCLDEAITRNDFETLGQGILAWHREQAPSVETSLVFRDSAFADDVVKTNLTAILRQGGLDHVRSL